MGITRQSLYNLCSANNASPFFPKLHSSFFPKGIYPQKEMAISIKSKFKDINHSSLKVRGSVRLVIRIWHYSFPS